MLEYRFVPKDTVDISRSKLDTFIALPPNL
jgi:hypothetical protein